MRLSQVLHGPPIFRYWKHFGAGYQKRQPNFKQWRYNRLAFFERRVIPDHTLPLDKLPAGARVLDATQFLEGHIDELPEQLLERNHGRPVVYDHPWPYNIKLDSVHDQEPIHCYSNQTRFFKPLEDCQILTNSLIETDSLAAHPPLEPSGEHMETVQRQITWASKDDSVLVRLPKDKSANWPMLNRPVMRSYGLTKERIEVNIMNTMTAYSQTLLAKYYHEQRNQAKLDEILNCRSLAYPHCVVPFERDQGGSKIHMDLFIDSMITGRQSLPQINQKPADTETIEAQDIRPRTWRSLLEKTRQYSPSWSFTLPRDAQLHTIQVASRIKRKHRYSAEMTARLVVHAFGVASQFARLRAVSNENVASGGGIDASCFLLDPLAVKQVNQKDLLEAPVVLQAIGYDHHLGQFHFMRYQLNTVHFDDQNPQRAKNQVWHSGPISELEQALRYYLDFQSFDSTQVARMLADTEAARRAKLDSQQTDSGHQSAMAPEKLAEGY